MNGHFKRLFSEITSVCRTILQFFNILTLQQRNIATEKHAGPIYAQVLTSDIKLSRSEGKKDFLCKCCHHISIKKGLRRLNWVVSHIKHQQTRNTAQFWATKVFELSYLPSKIFCNKIGGLTINIYRKLNTHAKDLKFSRICRRLVDVGDDMIPYS